MLPAAITQLKREVLKLILHSTDHNVIPITKLVFAVTDRALPNCNQVMMDVNLFVKPFLFVKDEHGQEKISVPIDQSTVKLLEIADTFEAVIDKSVEVNLLKKYYRELSTVVDNQAEAMKVIETFEKLVGSAVDLFVTSLREASIRGN